MDGESVGYCVVLVLVDEFDVVKCIADVDDEVFVDDEMAWVLLF
jgi:hypothetical protein